VFPASPPGGHAPPFAVGSQGALVECSLATSRNFWGTGTPDDLSVFTPSEVIWEMFRNNVKTVVLLAVLGALFMGEAISGLSAVGLACVALGLWLAHWRAPAP